MSEFMMNVGDKIRIGWVSSMRTIMAKPSPYTPDYRVDALMENNSATTIHVYDKSYNTIATALIAMPYYH